MSIITRDVYSCLDLFAYGTLKQMGMLNALKSLNNIIKTSKYSRILLTLSEFLDMLLQKIDQLTTHHYIARNQSHYLSLVFPMGNLFLLKM